MKLHAKGQARHRFWGEYSAHIILGFESREAALLAQPILNKDMDFGDFLTAGGGRAASEGWRHIRDGQGDVVKALFLEAADPVLILVVQRLVSYGAEEKKILSMARSIDYGEVFEIEIEVEDPNQTELKLEK